MITILVVEDDTKLNFIVSKKLGEEGFEVKRAENPIQAFDIMEKTKVDMIVSDIMMPQMDGYEFAREVRSFDDKMPILFMTAKDARGSLASQSGYCDRKAVAGGQSGSKGRRDYGLLRGRGTSAYGKGIPDSL